MAQSETPIKTKTHQVFVSPPASSFQVCADNKRPNVSVKELNANTSDASCNSTSGISDISSSDLNSTNTQKLNTLNAANTSTSSNPPKSKSVSKLKLDYLQKQHRDSGFIDDKCLSHLNTQSDQDMSCEQYGRPPGPLIYAQDQGYFVLEQQLRTAILPKEFADTDERESAKQTVCNKPLSIMKPTKSQLARYGYPEKEFEFKLCILGLEREKSGIKIIFIIPYLLFSDHHLNHRKILIC